jgi:hydrogenase/urease accessory protein HupE
VTASRFVSTALTALAGVALSPSVAEAHLVTTGLGPVYDGVTHVLMSLDDLVPIVAVAMLAGLNGPAAGRWTLAGLTAAWVAGGLAGFAAGAPASSPAVCGSFIVIGLLAALDRRLSPATTALLAAAVGGLHGWLNGVDAVGIAGIAVATFSIVTIVSATVVSLASGWRRVALRVAGSWVAAVGILMLGWHLRSIA